VHNKILIASVGEINNQLFKTNTNHDDLISWSYVKTPQELVSYLKTNSPKYIFFPHWNWIVPSHIVNQFDCVCFHMTDLPYGRGGSPLQNLIVRGHKNTYVSALKMDEGIDTGPIYLKEPLLLDGSAHEIYNRAGKLIWKMIKAIIDKNISPIPQEGKPVIFKRRLQSESKIPSLDSCEKIYDYIRMLDAPGYPHAYIDYDIFRIEFTEAKFSNNQLTASVKINLREN